MIEHNPRNRNLPTKEAPKSTARWFDNLVEDRRNRPASCGFHIPEKDQ